MRKWVALLLALAACQPAGRNNPTEVAAAGVSIEIESEDVIEGRRPTLTISCAPAGGSFWLGLVRTPDPPPAPRGSFGTIKIDDHAPLRVEMAWLAADRWAVRLDHQDEAALVRAMVSGRNVYFSGPEGSTDRAYRWDLARIGGGIEELRRACG